MIFPSLGRPASDIEQYIYESNSVGRDTDTIVFAIEKACNEHPADFQSLIEYLKINGKRRNTKKLHNNERGHFPWTEAVRA